MKSILKEGAHWIAILIVGPLYLFYLSATAFMKREGLFMGCSQLLSLVPGVGGNYLRKGFYHLTMTECAKECVISFGTLFSQVDTEIGDKVYIGPQCNIGRSRIGKNTLLGSGVHIMSGKNQHNFDDLEQPIQEQGGSFEKISIGEDCWVGNGSLIMANVGHKSVVGAGSVVINDVPPYSIVAGNPAKVIKVRK